MSLKSAYEVCSAKKDDRTFSNDITRDVISPRSKWNELTKQMIASSSSSPRNYQENYLALDNRGNICNNFHDRSAVIESPVNIVYATNSFEKPNCQFHNDSYQKQLLELDLTKDFPDLKINDKLCPRSYQYAVDATDSQTQSYSPIESRLFASPQKYQASLYSIERLPSTNMCQNEDKKQYNKKPYRLKVRGQIKEKAKVRKRKVRRRSWRKSSLTCERIEEDRRRRRNYKILHRRRASSISVQKTRNVTKSMKCMLAVKKQRVNPLSDRLCFAIYATFCCCLPIGLASIFFSLKVRKHLRNDKREKAMLSSLMSRKLASAAVVCGLVISAVSFIYYFVQMTEPYATSDYDYYFPEYG